MKRLFFALAGIIIAATIMAQAPNAVKYQAVARDANGDIIENQSVNLSISILKGSVTGTEVFTETHDSTTNAYGLVSLNIGAGNPTDFSNIDWANGPYFVKVVMDGNVMGTSQLLSVPYAKYAGEAGNVFSGSYNDLTDVPANIDTDATDDFDGDFNSLSNVPANLDTDATDDFDGDYNSLTNIPDLSIYSTTDTTLDESEVDDMVANNGYAMQAGLNDSIAYIKGDLATKTALSDSVSQLRSEIPVLVDGSETNVTAGTNITVTGTGTSGDPYVVNASAGSTNNFYLGQDTLGGIVFYIYLDQNGDQHGLIVSKTETTNQWQSTTSTTNATRSWDGVYNMGLMTNSPTKTWVTGLGTDWYLPSIDELSILWHNRFHANKGLNDASATLLSNTAYYWSSTEYNASNAFYFLFNYGYTGYRYKTTTYSVRAVRAF